MAIENFLSLPISSLEKCSLLSLSEFNKVKNNYLKELVMLHLIGDSKLSNLIVLHYYVWKFHQNILRIFMWTAYVENMTDLTSCMRLCSVMLLCWPSMHCCRFSLPEIRTTRMARWASRDSYIIGTSLLSRVLMCMQACGATLLQHACLSRSRSLVGHCKGKRLP